MRRRAGETLLSLRVDTRRHSAQAASRDAAERDAVAAAGDPAAAVHHPVSYTHLTLPTILRV